MSSTNTRNRRSKMKAAKQRRERHHNREQGWNKDNVHYRRNSEGTLVKITEQSNGDMMVEKVDESRREKSAQQSRQSYGKKVAS